MAGSIFISYRRGDEPGFSGRLFDWPEEHFGSQHVFMDVDNIPAGQDFVRVLEDAVAKCDVLLVMVGKGWVAARNDTGNRRLDDPKDFVRIEIVSGLKHGRRVIPVLVNDATMPREDELPEELWPLVRRNAVRLTHQSFKPEAQNLIRQVERARQEIEQERKQKERLNELETQRSFADAESAKLRPRGYEPMWILGGLGAVAGLIDAMLSFDMFGETIRMYSVLDENWRLLIPLVFGSVLGFGAYRWGNRRWYVFVGTCALYAVIAAYCRYWFEENLITPGTLDELRNLSWAVLREPGAPHEGILRSALLLSAVGGAATIFAAAPFVHAMDGVLTQLIGALFGAFFCFLGIYSLWFFMNIDHEPATNSGLLNWVNLSPLLITYIVWSAALGANVGWVYVSTHR